MDNLMWALIFYIAGAVIRTAYGFLAKIATTPTNELHFDVSQQKRIRSLQKKINALLVATLPRGEGTG